MCETKDAARVLKCCVMNCYVLYKTVKIFFFCQGPRRTADLLLSGPGSEMFGVLPDWASLQDQANLTLVHPSGSTTYNIAADFSPFYHVTVDFILILLFH